MVPTSRFIARLIPVALATAFGLTSHPLQAAEGPWSRTAEASARLVSAVEATGDLSSLPVGLEVELAPGWKTYWRSPGDAGLPARLDWTGSSNLTRAELAYPTPTRFELFGLQTFGYHDRVLFPIALEPADPGQPLDLALRADLLVCSDICIPVSLDLALSLPAGTALADPVVTREMAMAEASVPGEGAAIGVTLVNVSSVDGGSALKVVASAVEPFAAPDVLPEFEDAWAFGAPRVELSDGGRRLEALLPVTQAPQPMATLAGTAATVTITDLGRGAEFKTVVVEGGATRGAGFVVILATALLGGLILNLMPCVLPVLSLKLLGVVGKAGAGAARARIGFLATAAGIVTSFGFLAAAAITAKSLGATVGWGIQFQQPVFLAAMIALLTLFASNLVGLFEIRLPGAIADRAGSAGREGGSLGGSFLTGAFATLLATPCSAPFVGTAVAFALARGPGEILAIFLVMGIGLALPYLAIAAIPGLARRLPRPGPWIAWFKRGLAVALLGTAAWLATVLVAQAGSGAVWAVALLMAVLVGGLAVNRRGARRLRTAGAVVAATAFVVAVMSPVLLGQRSAEPASIAADWTPFERSLIAREVADGRTVLVDVTADWCLTCKVNEILVLTQPTVVAALDRPDRVAMRADWTNPDDEIARFLADHGRFGIPFAAVFGPRAPGGILLPELLSEASLIEALDAAAALDSGS